MQLSINALALVATALILGCTNSQGPDEAKGEAIEWSPRPALNCGTYVLNGQIRLNEQGQYVLVMRADSPSAFDVVLLGGDQVKLIDAQETLVAAKVYFPQPSQDNRVSMAYLEDIRNGDPRQQNPVLLQLESCGQMERFKAQ
ncbi:MAG: hypothetical protein H6624_04550 [Bdellovibrionaceae bacterium]|nr:hypothetical protein [Bdellovibrionales bacterium]MCB9083587.1 hypothetical protein [Pseudobdellovibrionaceae bacterium]